MGLYENLADGKAVNEAVIEAMCRAYWNERGSAKWENEGEQYRESIRQRMRAAVNAMEDFQTACEESGPSVEDLL